MFSRAHDITLTLKAEVPVIDAWRMQNLHIFNKSSLKTQKRHINNSMSVNVSRAGGLQWSVSLRLGQNQMMVIKYGLFYNNIFIFINSTIRIT